MGTTIETIDPLVDELPEGAEVVGFHLTMHMPGAKEPETRYLDTQELGSRDDIALRSTGYTAGEIIRVQSALGIAGIWFLAGRQAKTKDTLDAVLDMFTNSFLNRAKPHIEIDIEVPDEEELAEREFDAVEVDPEDPS